MRSPGFGTRLRCSVGVADSSDGDGGGIASARAVAVHCADVVRERVTEEMPASCEAVFDLVHDYARRLEWDTLLRSAFVEGGTAGTGAVAVCSGRWLVGGLTLRTVYVRFQRGTVAAVKMVNRPPLFARWAASIRHESLGVAPERHRRRADAAPPDLRVHAGDPLRSRRRTLVLPLVPVGRWRSAACVTPRG